MTVSQCLILDYSEQSVLQSRVRGHAWLLAISYHMPEMLSIKPTDRQTLNTLFKPIPRTSKGSLYMKFLCALVIEF